MTDKEIIKALDGADVFLRNRANSEPAQLNEYDIEAFIDIANVCDEAANLINRQKAEIENLKDILYDADGVNLVNYWHQQCKIAENGCRNFEEENKKLKAEIERLKNECFCLANERDAYKDVLDTAVVEALKEFAESLSEKAPHITEERFPVLRNEIDNLLKERVGAKE